MSKFYNPAHLLGNGGVHDARLLPKIFFFDCYSSMQHFNQKLARGLDYLNEFFLGSQCI